MRKTGLRSNGRRAGEIPFGVRAIQSGVEVEGIWISRSTSPISHLEKQKSDGRAASSTTKVEEYEEKPSRKVRGKEKYRGDDSGSLNSIRESRPSPTRNEYFESRGDVALSIEDTPHMAAPKARSQATHQRVKSLLNEETLRQLEGQTSRARINTYIPTSSFDTPHSRILGRQNSHTSASSATESTISESSSGRTGPRSQYTSRNPSSSSRHYVPRQYRPGYNAIPQGSPEQEPHVSLGSSTDTPAFSTPLSTPSHSFPPSRSDSQLPLLPRQQGPPIPEPTFGPGDIHYNRSARRVNEGFEVLPAGLLGLPPQVEVTNPDLESGELRETGGRKKLRKKSVSQTQPSGAP